MSTRTELVFNLMLIAVGLALLLWGAIALYRWSIPRKTLRVNFADGRSQEFKAYGDGWHNDAENISIAIRACESDCTLFIPAGIDSDVFLVKGRTP